jgi:hypothetical protein
LVTQQSVAPATHDGAMVFRGDLKDTFNSAQSSSITIAEDELSEELLKQFPGLMDLKNTENNYRQYGNYGPLKHDIISGEKVLKSGLNVDSVEYRDGKFIFNATNNQTGTNGMKVVIEDTGMRGTASFRDDVTSLTRQILKNRNKSLTGQKKLSDE